MNALMNFFDGLGKLTLAGIGCVVVCVCGTCIVGVVLLAGGERVANQQAIQDNGGYGSEDKPIPVGEYAQFKNGQVRLAETNYFATDRVLNETLLGATSIAAGSRYILLRFDLLCEKQQCDQSELDIRVMADDGKLWSEELSLAKYNEDFPDAVEGATSTGWQVFEFPLSHNVKVVRVKWEGVTLYLDAP